MNEDQVESFLAIVREGSMNRAAERRFISQPALRKQVDALEAELGVTLLRRTPHGCSPTRAGEFFAERMGSIQTQIRDVKSEIITLRDHVHGPVRISVNPGIATPFLDEACQRIQRCEPRLKFNYVPVPYQDRISALRQGKIDLFLGIEIDAIIHDPLLRTRRLTYDDALAQEASTHCGCLMGEEDELCRKSLLTLSDLKGRTVAAPDPMLFRSLILQARNTGTDLDLQTLDSSMYAIIEFCNQGGLYLLNEGLWSYGALRYARLDYPVPPQCIITLADAPLEVEQAAEALLAEYGRSSFLRPPQ